MNHIQKQVVNHLETLALKGPKAVEAVLIDSSQEGKYLVGVPSTGKAPKMSMVMDDYDRYTGILRQLDVSCAKNSLGADLETIAERIADRLTYLEEAVAVVELDKEQQTAQLRSQPPQQLAEEAVAYWEIVLQVESSQPRAILRRYRWLPNQTEREQLSYPATFHTIGHLAQDLAESMLEKKK